MKILSTGLVLALLAAAASALQPTARAQSGPSRVIDRTFGCSVLLRAGVRFLEVSARSGTREADDRRRWAYLAAAEIGDRDGAVVSVAAGGPSSEGGARPAPPQREGMYPFSARWLAIDPQKCRATATRIPLSAAGLVGGPASPLSGLHHVGSDAYECRTPSRVLVRIRTVFRAPTTLRAQSRYGQRTLSTPNAAVVRESRLAVRTPSGRPLVYAEVFESGRARLFTARTCVPD